MKNYTLSTEAHTDSDGNPSKKIVITGAVSLSIALGSEEARLLSAALKANGRDISLVYGVQQS